MGILLKGKPVADSIAARVKDEAEELRRNNIKMCIRDSYYSSQTARNFFGVINVDYNFAEGSGDLEDVIEVLKNKFKENLKPEIMARRINKLSSLEHNYFLRVIPLKVKNLILRMAYAIADRSYTSTLSNVGIINMPDDIKPFIYSFDIFVSTDKIQACVNSFENILRISFTSAFVSTEIQRRFFKTLTDMGINVTIESNIIDEEEEVLF